MRTLSHVPWPHLAVLLFVAALTAFVVNGGLDTPEPVTASTPLPILAPPRAPQPAPSTTVEVVVAAIVAPPVASKPAPKSAAKPAAAAAEPAAKAAPVSPSRPRAFRLLRRR
jgi:hypothetical protein